MNTIKYLFQTLYKNQVVLEGRKKPWYFAISMFVLGFFMMWIPILSKGYTTYCASAMFNTSSTTNQEIDKGFLSIFEEDYFKSIKFKKNSKTGSANLDFSSLEERDQDNNPVYYVDLATEKESNPNSEITSQTDSEYRGTNSKSLLKSRHSFTVNSQTYGYNYYYDVITTPISNDSAYKQPENTSSITYEDSSHSNSNVILLQAFYLDLSDDYSDSDAISNFVKKVILRISDDDTQMDNYPHSFVVFAPNRIYLNIYSMHSSKTNRAIAGYQGYISEAHGDDDVGKTLYSEIANDTSTITSAKEKNKKMYQNFADTLHRMAFKSNVKTVWYNVAIISAVYAGTILVMSGILIFMHKRKLSTSKDATYWEALKEAMTMAFTPSIIGLAVGFYNYMFQIVLFIMLNLFRTFFMYSKIVPPAYKNDNKPLYQARQ